jgi:5'-3' exoribonuclease 1
MFRWLTDQYPNINKRLQEGLGEIPEVHNFYLDMNGIIHPCTHGNAEGEIIVLDETAMFKKIFLYVDRLYKLVKPTQVLYLAVDGVAPRAKMNQQRSRRFRSAKEAEQTAAEILAREGRLNVQNRFDSNCITPGTDFMLKLSLALQKWVAYKQRTDPFWQHGADVIVSGPDVPGEGEHKVMDFVRACQEEYAEKGDCKWYAPNQVHLLYGLDADLIMLGLVTGEPNFMLLREKMSVVMAGRGRNKHQKKKDMMEYNHNDFEVLELSSLRQLLAIQFRKFVDILPDYDLNRVIDDFVFMCMLVGNDFLSHVPHLEIDNGAISLMITNYIDLLPEWGGYLTDKEKIHPKRLEQFLYNLAAYEEEHFYRRGMEENEPGWKLSAENELEEDDFYGTFYGGGATPAAAVPANVKGAKPPPSSTTEQELTTPNDNNMETAGNRAFRRRHPDSAARSYRDFYYESKMGWSPKDRNATLFHRRQHVREYLEGLHWVLNYYHNGCRSWDWYFPYLYSPLCTDMVNLDEFYDASQEGDEYKTFHFESGTPFPSLAQLLSVLPPQSAELLPEPLAELMIHPSSPLNPYYPQDFTTDANGKRQSWEAVVQIPFIDADVLLDTVERVMEADEKADDESKLLSNAERRRNVPGKNHVFIAPHRTGEVERLSQEERESVNAAAAPSPPPPRRMSNSRRSNNNGNGRGGPRGGVGGGAGAGGAATGATKRGRGRPPKKSAAAKLSNY